MRFIFSSVTGSKTPFSDQSVRYRCLNPIEDFISFGHKALFVPFSDLENVAYAKSDVLFIHRPLATGGKADFYQRLRDKGVLLVADYDDLVFDPEYAEDTFYMFWASMTPEKVQQRVQDNLDAMK